MEPTGSIKLNIDSWKIKLQERSRNRMKLQFKLSKEEAEAFKNFTEVCKPNDISDDQWLKTIMFMGVEAANNRLSEMVQQYAKENKEDLASSGITVIEDEDGNVELKDADAEE